MLPLLAYRYVKNQREKTNREMTETLQSLTSNLPKSIMPDKAVLKITGVSAKLTDEEDSKANDLIPGTLSIVEKATGVYVEWQPTADEETGWVLTEQSSEEGGTLHSAPQTPISPKREIASAINKLRFSVDVNDISSFKIIDPKKGKGYPCIRLICRDGTNHIPLFFLTQSTKDFIDVLQRYATLRRSAKEQQLVLVIDEKTEALAQSVSMLDQNGDIMTRFMNNPYAAAMTGLGKITHFVQEQMIPAILDSEDAVSTEEKIRAMKELTNQETIHFGICRAEGDFEMVTQLDLPPRPDIFRESPVKKETWDSFKLPDGTFDQLKMHHLLMNIFRGGLEPSLRGEAWKFLLGYYDTTATPAQNLQKRARLAKDYERMKGQWQSISDDQQKRFSKFVNRKAIVEKDVARTDRNMKFFLGDNNANVQMLHNVLMTYCMYDFDLGYVQGMSDFCSPLLTVMQNEVDTFWCFVGVMNKVHANFEKDQTAIKVQLNQLRDILMIINPKLANYLEGHESDDMYFCFRWLIVWFKREFSFEDTCKLWEVLWTSQPCPNFLLLCCAATLDAQSNIIIENKFGLTEILKHVNDLSMHHCLDEMLTSAEAIFHQLSASQDKLPSHICEYLHLGDRALQSISPSSDEADN